MTKAEAEKEVEELNNSKGPSWFCPLIKGDCRQDCITYVEAFYYTENPRSGGNLVDVKRNDYHVQQPFCNNAMFVEMELVCPSHHE
uniref:Uncharacterized protein n=1 Tax=viral metagenome TaxID=1070528 RepID=A0A6M3KQ99_9ZZZZ